MKKLFMGVKIKKLREERQLTQQALADSLGISLSYLNQMENNQRPLTISVLLKLNAAFGIDIQLFSEEADARLIGELREALFDPAINERIAIAELQELASGMPAIGRAIVSLHKRLHRTSEQSTALALRLGDERQGDPGGLMTAPFEEVRDFFYARNNYIDAIDRRAEAMADQLDLYHGNSADRLKQYLSETHDIRVIYERFESTPQAKRNYRADNRSLHLSARMTSGQQAFQMATQIAFLELGELIDTEISHALFSSAEARTLARIGIANYFAGALILPYGTFLKSAEELRYDISLLEHRFGVGFETVCHRLSTLQRDGASGVPFFFIRVDRAGNISKRQSATNFHFSRTGGTCPLWNVYEAFTQPGRILTQLSEMPDGRTYLWIARTVEHSTGGYGDLDKSFAIGLGCDLQHARKLVYSKGLLLDDPGARTPIGAGCKICERPHCPQRAFPPAIKSLIIDHNRSSFTPYSEG
ncbi:MAG: Cro/Cl family transcriptional regulator [Sneathiella sp.]|jgi:predicted transcriptional regulator/transcriptional regulator with XRE-family HTH domain|uniref:short-chain fatty acyl-CoA regulator family protein n=1 Tax=Sneathiella sp. TaxID=1964365 RepID=UPI000C505109|nr:short-chain fatty acyl-CoA regulator family protein [Sneathiella sp.]MAL77838.1 Cro/Cl family transcriptional regulator [Sneathiella sp.]|tara:strand:- start:30 stop:1451 length:1422 start_codon:yes stop_codon:yes gene_type:complete